MNALKSDKVKSNNILSKFAHKPVTKNVTKDLNNNKSQIDSSSKLSHRKPITNVKATKLKATIDYLNTPT